MKKALAIILAAVLALTLTACGETDGDGTDKALKIGILQYAEHGALDQAREGFIAALADNGLVDGDNIEIDLQIAQGDQSNLQTMGERFISNKSDLVLAIATPAAVSFAGQTQDIPLLFTAVTDPVDARLVASNEAPGGNVTGTNDMNPVEDQIDLLLQFVPDAGTIGIIYNSSEPNSVVQADIAAAALQAKGIQVETQTVTSSNDVQQAMQSLVGKIDGLYVPTDNILATAIPLVADIANPAGIPIVCGEYNMVAEGGLATVGINYYDLGYQTGLMAVRILKEGADPATMPVESPKSITFAVNGDTAAALGIEVPEDLQQFII